MKASLGIIIATHRRNNLLERTLNTISKEKLPDSLSQICIVENGRRANAEFICKKYRSVLPINYIYSRCPNKSNALNVAISKLNTEFILVFDDDIRLSGNTLLSYDKAVQNYGKNHFFGGPVFTDCESNLPSYIIPHLPSSVAGFNLGPAFQEIRPPKFFLGCNFGFFKKDAQKYGFFNDRFGASNHLPVGEETYLQKQLYSDGLKGIYIPSASVWHFVSKSRCTPQWVLKRLYRYGKSKGTMLVMDNLNSNIASSRIQSLRNAFFKTVWKVIKNRISFKNIEERFDLEASLKEIAGEMIGIMRAKKIL